MSKEEEILIPYTNGITDEIIGYISLDELLKDID